MTAIDTTDDDVTDQGQVLRLVRGSDVRVDLAAAERAVTDLLVSLGQDPSDPHTEDTPRRVAAAYAELLTPRA